LEEPDYLEFLKNEKLLEPNGATGLMHHPLMEHARVTFM
jgi:hypothetical protein